MDAVRGDEVWNSSQQWYLNYDNLNSNGQIDIGDQWIWRDNYHVVNRCNFVLSKVGSARMADTKRAEIKGQALFLRALAYYELATYYQTVPLYTDYSDYSSLEGMYAHCSRRRKLVVNGPRDALPADLPQVIWHVLSCSVISMMRPMVISRAS